jgi:hypothetical protein
MKIELTEDQQRQLDQSTERPVPVEDPRSKAEYRLVPAAEYDQMLSIVQDDAEQRAVRRAAARGLASRLAGDEA